MSQIALFHTTVTLGRPQNNNIFQCRDMWCEDVLRMNFCRVGLIKKIVETY